MCKHNVITINKYFINIDIKKFKMYNITNTVKSYRYKYNISVVYHIKCNYFLFFNTYIINNKMCIYLFANHIFITSLIYIYFFYYVMMTKKL